MALERRECSYCVLQSTNKTALTSHITTEEGQTKEQAKEKLVAATAALVAATAADQVISTVAHTHTHTDLMS